MNKEEISEGNNLIAEFMGDVTISQSEWVNSGKELVAAYLYDYSWDWLMPVVEKIEMDSSLFLNISGKECNIILHSKEEIREPLFEWDETAETKIESVWKSAIEFIKYYNQQLNNNHEMD